MPVVPASAGSTVGQSPTPSLRAPIESFGGGAATRSTDIQPFANAANGIYSQAKQRADQVAVVDAGSKLSALETSLLYDPQSGVLSSKGKNAIDAADTANAAWEKQTGDLEDSLSNDDQKGAFRRMVAAHGASLNEQIQRHVSNEQQTYDQQSTAAYVSNEQAAGVNGTPERTDMAIANQRAAIMDFGKRSGWSDDQTQMHIADNTSKTRFGVLERLVDGEQDLAATKYLNDHREDFVGSDLLRAEKLTDAGSTRAASQRAANAITLGDQAGGQLTKGNIDLTNRPRVQNADGSISTVRSISINEDGKEILIPTVSQDGKSLTNDEAVEQYHKTGQHLGIFADETSANLYAEKLHQAQSDMLAGKGNGVPPSAATSLGDALQQVQSITDPKTRDATESRVRRFYADQATDVREQRAASFDKVGQILEQNGGDITKLPIGDMQNLSPEQHSALEARADRIRHPKVETNVATYTHLSNLSSISDASRQSFVSLDLTDPKYTSSLSDADWHRMVNLQATVRDQMNRADASADKKTATGDVSLKRKEEASVIKQSAAAQKVQATNARAASIPGLEQFAAPVPKVSVPQWMIDSTSHDAGYYDYLKGHGVPGLGARPSAPTIGGAKPTLPAGPKVPGAPIDTLNLNTIGKPKGGDE